MDELTSALKFLMTGGSILLADWIVSWFLEDTKFWHELKSKTRRIVSLLLASGIGVTAYVASVNQVFLDAIAPVAQVLLAVGGSWYAQQLLHKKNPNRKE